MNTSSSSRSWLFWCAVIGGLLVFLFLIKSILLPFVVGIAVAYFLDPAADRLERAGCSRPLATTLITGCFFVAIGWVVMLLIPIIATQFTQLMQTLPATVATLQHALEQELKILTGALKDEQLQSAKQAVSGLSDDMIAYVTEISKGLLKSGFAVINLLSLMVITPIVSFYLLRDWDAIKQRADNLLPRQHAAVIREQLVLIDQAISGFVRGTVNVMLILAIYYAIALSVAGLNFAVLIGIFAGVAIIIPYLGTILTAFFALGMAYFQFGLSTDMAVVGVIFVLGQMAEGYVLTPKLVGEKVGLHPLWLIFGMLAGATLFGFVGVFLAIPATAVVGVMVRFAIQRYLSSDYYIESNAQHTKPRA